MLLSEFLFFVMSLRAKLVSEGLGSDPHRCRVTRFSLGLFLPSSSSATMVGGLTRLVLVSTNLKEVDGEPRELCSLVHKHLSHSVWL